MYIYCIYLILQTFPLTLKQRNFQNTSTKFKMQVNTSKKGKFLHINTVQCTLFTMNIYHVYYHDMRLNLNLVFNDALVSEVYNLCIYFYIIHSSGFSLSQFVLFLHVIDQNRSLRRAQQSHCIITITSKMYVWKCKLIFSTDTLQLNTEI